MLRGTQRVLLGCFCLTGVIILWVASGFLVQLLFTTIGFAKPICATSIQLALGAILLLPHVVDGARYMRQSMKGPYGITLREAFLNYMRKRPSDSLRENNDEETLIKMMTLETISQRPAEASKAEVLRLAIPFGVFWYVCQVLFNMSLMYLTVPTNNVLSSTSIFYTYILCLVILKTPFKIGMLTALLCSFSGVAVISLSTPNSVGTGITDTFLGYILASLSAVGYAGFVTGLKIFLPEDDGGDMGFFFGCIGVVVMFTGPPTLLLLHLTGLETFVFPNLSAIGMMLFNGFFGTVLANYLWGLSVVFLNPIMATVGPSLQIPLAIFIDGLILKEHSFTVVYVVGSLMVLIGVVATSIDAVVEEKKVEHQFTTLLSSELHFSHQDLSVQPSILPRRSSLFFGPRIMSAVDLRIPLLSEVVQFPSRLRQFPDPIPEVDTTSTSVEGGGPWEYHKLFFTDTSKLPSTGDYGEGQTPTARVGNVGYGGPAWAFRKREALDTQGSFLLGRNLSEEQADAA